MKFHNCENYYPTLSEAIKDPRRKALVERHEDFLENLESTLFDAYDVEGLYIVNDFFNKSLFSIDQLPIYWEMNKRSFEEFVDKREAEFLTEYFDMYIETNNELFHYNNGYWKSEGDKIIKKELWKK
jgi:hypothetical protein